MCAGPRTAKGESVAVGTAYGNEATMPGVTGQSPMGVATALFQCLIFQDPNWDWNTLDIDRDIDFGEKVLGTVQSHAECFPANAVQCLPFRAPPANPSSRDRLTI